MCYCTKPVETVTKYTQLTPSASNDLFFLLNKRAKEVKVKFKTKIIDFWKPVYQIKHLPNREV